MTHADFCHWLSGYLDGCGDKPDLALIRKKLGEARMTWGIPPAIMPSSVSPSIPNAHPNWGYPIFTCSQVTPVLSTYMTN